MVRGWCPWLVSCSVAMACGRPNVPVAPVQSSQTTMPAPRASAPTSALERPRTWRLVAFPRTEDSAKKVEEDNQGTLRLISWQTRVEVRGQKVSFASDAPSQYIHQSCRSDTGWIHEAGLSLYGSDTFLGALRPLGSTNQGIAQCAPVVTTGNKEPAQLWSRSGRQAIPAIEDADWFHFTSSTDGRLIRFPDLLFESHDGGHTFVPSTDRASNPATWLNGRGPAKELRLDPRFNESGGLKDEPLLDRILRRRLRQSAESPVEATLDGLHLSDGSWVRSVEHDGREFVAIRSPDGHVTTTTVEGASKLVAWGNRLLAVLKDRDQHLRKVPVPTFRVIHPRREALPEPPVAVEYPLVDPTGRRILAKRQLSSDERLAAALDHGSADHGPGSWIFDGHTWRVHDALRGAFSAIHGDWVEQGVSVMRLSDASPKPVDLGFEAASISDLRLTADGVRFIHTLEPSNPQSKTELVYRRFDAQGQGRSTILPLPFAAQSVDFADPDHGIAKDSARALHATADGGKTWHELGQAPSGSSIDCHESSSSCIVDQDLLFTSEEGPHTTIAPEPPPPPPAVPEKTANDSDDDSGSMEPVEIADYFDCRSKPQPKPKRGTVTADAAAQSGGGATAEPSTRVRVTGLDSLGAFVFEATPTGQPAVGLLASETVPLEQCLSKEDAVMARIMQPSGRLLDCGKWLNPEIVTRRFVIYGLADWGKGGTWWLLLHESGQLEPLFGTLSRTLKYAMLPGGSVLVSVDQGRYSDVYQVSPEGRVAAHRWFMQRQNPQGATEPMHLTLGPSGPGYALREGQELRNFTLVPGTPSATLRLPVGSTYTVCRGPADPETTTVFGHSAPQLSVDGERAENPLDGPDTEAAGDVDIGPTRSCLRTVTTSIPYDAYLYADGGVLRGAVRLSKPVEQGEQVTWTSRVGDVTCVKKRQRGNGRERSSRNR
jgi:hypothetical protein